MKTLVLGIGNDILGDDAVGIHIAREIAGKIKSPEIDVKETGATGLNLLDVISGYDKLFVIDAILSNQFNIGQINRLELKDLEPSNSITPHEAGLRTTIELGNQLFPGQMPREVIIYGVQIENVEKITVEMTPTVKAAIPEVVKRVMAELKIT